MGDWHAEYEVACDERGRVSLLKAGAVRDQRYKVSSSEGGVITLTPVVSIPQEEIALWEDSRVREALLRGMLDAAEGRVDDLESVIGTG